MAAALTEEGDDEERRRWLAGHEIPALVDGMVAELLAARPPAPRPHLHRWLQRDSAAGAAGGLRAVVFDVDGVLTRSDDAHCRSYKATFDSFLRERDGPGFRPFTEEEERLHVRGRPRTEAIENFLLSRGIAVPPGDPSDPPDRSPPTVHSIGSRKNAAFRQLLAAEGCPPYMTSIRVATELRLQGVRVGFASSSTNARAVLAASQILHLFEEGVDGADIRRLGLRGKPAGDLFVTCCRRLGVEPRDAAVVEDAVSGVAAGRDGGFRLIVGLARDPGGEADLRAQGAHVVLPDFGAHTAADVRSWFAAQPVPRGA